MIPYFYQLKTIKYKARKYKQIHSNDFSYYAREFLEYNNLNKLHPVSMERKKFQDIRKALQEKGYQIRKSIGRGAFGEVILTVKRPQNTQHAVKVISKAVIKKKPFLKKYIDQQIEIMKKLDHPSIVRQDDSFETHDFIFIVLEYCEVGNLLSYQSKLNNKTFTLKQALDVVCQVLKGLKCIHEKNFIHRDIKSQNVLIKKNNGQLIFKIADFGFARAIGGVGAKTHCGTEKYMAPQIICNSYYGISVDIWALGVLFYFMLFAQYPFKGHDMKAEISRRCNPYFNLNNVISKKQKLHDIPIEVEDFFKKIFVQDSKKRMTFSSIVTHPLLRQFETQFQQNTEFYSKLEQQEELVKDRQTQDQYGIGLQMEVEDDTRVKLFTKKAIGNTSKHIQRQLQEINFEIQKIIYLQQCASEMFDNYSAYLTYAERLAAKFYLLKAVIFYSDPLLKDLLNKTMPESLADADITPRKWKECTGSVQYSSYVQKIQGINMRGHINYQDTYIEASKIINQIPVKNFHKGYRLSVDEKTFDAFKFAYRSTTSHIFKKIHQNKKIDSHKRNKIKMRLFCCHMINRIFNRKEVNQNFPYFSAWLIQNNLKYQHSFEFSYFKTWIYKESEENLEKNIALLHKNFF